MTHHLISLSGGIGSGASALIAHENDLDFSMAFADTLIEDDDLYRFNADIARAVGKELRVCADGRNPWGVFAAKRYIGNNRVAPCSDELKTKQIAKVLAEAPAGSVLVLGMYLDEEDRLERARKKWAPQAVSSLLIEHSVTPGNARQLLAKYNIPEPRLYSYGFPHNNCGGFCVRAGQGQFATLLQHFPERYKAHEDAQEITMAWIGNTAKPFIRVTLHGEKLYLTMREFRLWVQDGTIKPAMYEMGGCGCFVD